MVTSIVYDIWKSDIIDSYILGDFDNSYNQLRTSLEIFDKLFARLIFTTDLESDKIKLLTEVQKEVDHIHGLQSGTYGGKV